MSLFNEILQKIQTRLQGTSFDCEKIANILSKELGFEITKDAIVVNNKTITLILHPFVRQEILLRKKQLLES